jgi:hypothetical protein
MSPGLEQIDARSLCPAFTAGKILLSTSCAVTLLFGITLLVVLGNVNRSLSDSLKEKEEVRDSFRAYESALQARQELMRSVRRIVSEMKKARSAIGTGDKAAIEVGASELWAKVSRTDAIFPIADPNGKFLASLGVRHFAIADADSGDCPHGRGAVSGPY